jgi:hypothetical protein
MIATLTIELIPGGLALEGRNWIGELPSAQIEQVLGKPSRVEVKFSKGRPWRTVSYYDENGIYVLNDIETKRAVYIGIALIPEATAFPTRSAFSGQIYLNGARLMPGMKCRELPLRGTINLVKGIGSMWKCAHDNSYVELNLKKVLQPNGRKSSEPVLVSVTHSFLRD